MPIPYVPVGDEYFKPFTGIVLIDDTETGIPQGGKKRFVSEQGEAFLFTFAAESSSFRSEHGDWGFPEFFNREASLFQTRAGNNPLVLNVTRLSTSGDIVLSDRHISLIEKVSNIAGNHLLGGVITVTR